MDRSCFRLHNYKAIFYYITPKNFSTLFQLLIQSAPQVHDVTKNFALNYLEEQVTAFLTTDGTHLNLHVDI